MFTSAWLVTWRSEVPAKPYWANSSSAAPRIRSLVEKAVEDMSAGCRHAESNDCLMLRPAVIGRQSDARISRAMSAKPAPRRGFFLPEKNANGAGAHPFDHQARCRRQERHRRNLFPLREGRPEGRRRPDEAPVPPGSRGLLCGP